jgi:guanylate kinase
MTDHSRETGAPRNPYAGAYPGNLFMVVAPSGAGKSTLVNALLAGDDAIRLSISYTTRPPRPKEQDGEHYHFTTVDDFMKRHDEGEFLESAEVHGNYYGTSRLWIQEQMKSGHDVLLEIDWQGAQQVKKQFHNAVEIFILPPSLDALEERLKKRTERTAVSRCCNAFALRVAICTPHAAFRAARDSFAARVSAAGCRAHKVE